MLLCGGFGYCILDRVQTQNILKHSLEVSAALDLGGQSACQTILEPQAVEKAPHCAWPRPSGSARLAAERPAGHGAWPTCLAAITAPRAGRQRAGELGGLCRGPCRTPLASLAMGLLPSSAAFWTQCLSQAEALALLF